MIIQLEGLLNSLTYDSFFIHFHANCVYPFGIWCNGETWESHFEWAYMLMLGLFSWHWGLPVMPLCSSESSPWTKCVERYLNFSACACRCWGYQGRCFPAYLDDVFSVTSPIGKPWRSAHFSHLQASTSDSLCYFSRSIPFWGSSQHLSGSTSAGGSPRRIDCSESPLFWRGLFHPLAGSSRPSNVPRKSSWQLLGWMLLLSIDCLYSGTPEFFLFLVGLTSDSNFAHWYIHFFFSLRSIRICSLAAILCLFGILPLHYFGRNMHHLEIHSEQLHIFSIGNVEVQSRWWAEQFISSEIFLKAKYSKTEVFPRLANKYLSLEKSGQDHFF